MPSFLAHAQQFVLSDQSSCLSNCSCISLQAGQALSLRPDLLPQPYLEALSELQVRSNGKLTAISAKQAILARTFSSWPEVELIYSVVGELANSCSV